MQIILLNKPFQVLSQFTDSDNRPTLASFVRLPGFYPAGRLDYQSEGLLLLTNSGDLQHRISDPQFKLEKGYWVQVEGKPDNAALEPLQSGVMLRDGKTRPARCRILQQAPTLWTRDPVVAQHRDQNSSWLDIRISEGKNRQVRRMMAHLGFPVLRLVRHQIGNWKLGDLQPGQYRNETVHLPKTKKQRPAR